MLQHSSEFNNEFLNWLNQTIGKRIRSGGSFASLASTGIANAVAILVIIIIVLAVGVGYFALSTEKSVVSSTVTSTKTTASTFANPLLMYSADAYENESGFLEKSFTAHTGIPMATPIAAGSSTLSADIAAGDPVSVFLSVSRTAVQGPALGSEFPGWAVAFAADQMGIAYSSSTASSAGGKTVIAAYNTAVATNTTAAWYAFFNNLASGSVKVGISNPNTDPAGFRAWMVLELAGIAYDAGVANEQYFLNRMLTNHGNITGASAASLVPALLTGQIQFLFIYKSDIASEGLSLVQLTNGVNLGLPSYNTFYGQATYTTSSGVQKGSAIVLWLTVPKDSTDLTDSVNFVIYTIQNYQNVLKSFGLVNLVPAQLYNTTGYTVPASLVSLLNAGTLVVQGPV